MRTLALLAAGLIGSAALALPAQARPYGHHGVHRAGIAPAPSYRVGPRRGVVGAGVGLAAGTVGLAAGTALAAGAVATDAVFGVTPAPYGSYGYTARPVNALAPVSYGGRSWNGPRTGLQYPVYNGFGGYYGNPDAFGGGYY